MKKIALVTGATGLLGSWLICALLRRGGYSKLYAIVRGASDASAKSRVHELLRAIPHKLEPRTFEKVTVIRGDVSEPNLGLSVNNFDSLIRGKLTDIFHSAAAADFNMTLTKIRPTNVVGTHNVFKMALALKLRQKDLPIRVHHVSTIAVGGNHQGWFSEDQFDVGQSFNNAYEQSKYEAEKIARNYWRSNLQVNIYRPAIITGDSQYGVTTNFKMVYQPLHFLSHNLFQELPADENCLHSFVPVDKVAEAISILSEHNLQKNNVYHLVNPYEIKLGDFVRISSYVLKFKKPLLVPLRYFQKDRLSAAQWGLINPFLPYLNYRLRLDSKATNGLLGTLGFQWPEVDESLLKRLLKFCSKSKFIPLGQTHAVN